MTTFPNDQATKQRRVGEEVSVDYPEYPGIWRIISIGPKNTVLEPKAGGRRLRCPHHMVVDARDDGPSVVGEPYVTYDLGEIVRLIDPRFSGLYVVVADKGARVNVAKLGGDNARYVRATRSGLVKVDPAEVLK